MFRKMMMAIALTGAAGSAMAQDASTAEPGGTWGGFYIGTDIGYSLYNTQFNLDPQFRFDGIGGRGASVGLFAGHDWLFGDNKLAGVEFGVNRNDIGSGLSYAIVNGGLDVLQGLDAAITTDWSASLSGRVGMFTDPSTLIFASFGVTGAHGIGSYRVTNNNVVTNKASDEDVFYGVAFGGIGTEIALSQRLRLRADYTLSYLSNTYPIAPPVSLEVSPLIGTAKIGLIYDFSDNGVAPQVTAHAPASWTGLYVGGGLGHDLGITRISGSNITDSGGFRGFLDGIGASGFSGTAVAGYNVELGEQFLLGAEAIVTGSTLATTLDFVGAAGPLSRTNDYSYGARLRAGYLVSPATMLYGFAGLSRVNSHLEAVDRTDGSILGEADIERNAVEFGAGFETYLTSSLSLRGEYGFTRLDSLSGTLGLPREISLDMDQQTAKAMLIYHFGQ